MGLVLVIPGFIQGIGWAMLLNGQNGIVNQVLQRTFGLESAPFEIYSLPGMTFVQGLNLVPEAFFLTLPMLIALDASYEEAAQLSGIGKLRTVMLIDLPLILPGLIASAIYLFTLGAALFEIPIILGFPHHIFVFSTLIFLLIQAPAQVPEYGLAAAYGTLIVLAGVLLVAAYGRILSRGRRYASITGKGRRIRVQRLGRARWPALAGVLVYASLAIGMPVVTLVYASLLTFLQLPSLDTLSHLSLDNYTGLIDFAGLSPLVNTAILVIVVPLAVVACALPVSYAVVRFRNRARFILDQIAFVPVAVPRIVVAVAILYLGLVMRPVLPLYGTLGIIAVAHTIIFLSFATRSLNGGLLQIHPELEEAGVSSGADRLTIMRVITLPLIRPTLFFTWFWVLLLTYREVTVAIMLASPGNVLLPTLVWNRWNDGQAGEAAAAAVILVVWPLLLMLLLRGRVSRLTSIERTQVAPA
jgi:iron(III) transport system permease protein